MNEPLTIQLDAPIPSKKNNRVVLKNGVNIPSREFREWHGRMLKRLKSVVIEHGTFGVPVSVSLGISFKDRHRRDLDNALTSAMDLVKDCGIIEDDDWFHVPRLSVEAVDFGEDYSVMTIAPVRMSVFEKLKRFVRRKIGV